MVTAVAGCSTARLAYNNAPWLLVRAADYYLDLNPEQERRAQRALERYSARHRTTELPTIVAALKEANIRTARPASAADVDWLFAVGRKIYRRTMSGLLPILASTLASLSPEQIEYLARRVAERNAERRQKYIDTDVRTRVERRSERIIERTEHWTGTLAPAQAVLIRRLRGQFPDTAAAWQVYKEGQQQRVLASLRNGRSAAELTRQLHAWLVDLEGLPDPLRDGRTRWLAAWQILLLQLDQSLHPEQRQALRNRIREYASALSGAMTS